MQGAGAPLLGVDARQEQRQAHVLEHRHRADQVEGLKDRGHPLQPVVGERILRQLIERQAGREHAARARPVKAAHQGQQRGLAAAGRPDHGDELARHDLERDVAQGDDLHVARVEAPGHGIEAQPDRLPKEVVEAVRRLGPGLWRPEWRGLRFGRRHRPMHAAPDDPAALPIADRGHGHRFLGGRRRSGGLWNRLRLSHRYGHSRLDHRLGALARPALAAPGLLGVLPLRLRVEFGGHARQV